MTTKDLYKLNQKSEIQPIHLSNPHPYPITLDLFNDFSGVNSSYYHQIKSATPRLSKLDTGEEITIENALFVQLFGGDVEVTDLDTNTIIIYNGENILLEHGFNLANNIRIRAISNPISLIWTKGEFFLNDSAVHPRGVCAVHFHPSTTDFYIQPLRWIKQDSFGNKKVESIKFNAFGPHFKNKSYLLKLSRILSGTDSFQLVLPPKSSLSIYLYSNEDCTSCLPTNDCSLDVIALDNPISCSEPIVPFWLILLLMIATAIMFFFRFENQT